MRLVLCSYQCYARGGDHGIGNFDQKQKFGVKLPNPWDKISIQSSPPVLDINKINQIHKILPISLLFLDYYFTVDFKSLFQNTLKRAVITINRLNFFALPALHKDLLSVYKAKTHKLLRLINQALQKIQQYCTNMQLHEKNWRSTHTQAPRIQNRGGFRRSNIGEPKQTRRRRKRERHLKM